LCLFLLILPFLPSRISLIFLSFLSIEKVKLELIGIAQNLL
jgi:hypothetical protein